MHAYVLVQELPKYAYSLNCFFSTLAPSLLLFQGFTILQSATLETDNLVHSPWWNAYKIVQITPQQNSEKGTYPQQTIVGMLSVSQKGEKRKLATSF